MPTIKFRPHTVTTFYNAGREAVAVDFTPTLSFDLDEIEREAYRRRVPCFVVQVFGASLNEHSRFIYQLDESVGVYRLLPW